MKKEQVDTSTYRRFQLFFIILSLSLIISYVIRSTELMKIYIINFVTEIIVSNTFNIVFILVILFILVISIKKIVSREEQKENQNGTD